MKNNRDHLLTKGYQRAKFEVQASFTLWDVVFTRFYKVFGLWPLVTSNDLWPPWKTIGIIYSPRATNVLSLKFRHHSLLEISCLQSFILWPLVTSNDLWPPWKTIGIIYSPRPTNVPSLKFKQVLLLEISCLQAKASHTHTRTHTYTHTHTHIHTHTHTHTPSPSHRFLRPSARNQKQTITLCLLNTT